MAPVFMIVPLLVLVAIPSVLYLSVSKRKSPVVLGFILAAIHLAFVLCAAKAHYASGTSEFPGVDFFFGLILYYIDMPISLFESSIAQFLELSSRSPGVFYFSLAYHGVLGSVQYFLWGLLFARLFAGRHSKERFHSE